MPRMTIRMSMFVITTMMSVGNDADAADDGRDDDGNDEDADAYDNDADGDFDNAAK